MTTIPVTASRTYDVCIESGCLERLGDHLLTLHKPCTVAVVTDDNVAPRYGKAVTISLSRAGFTVVQYVIPSGESAKNLSTYGDVLNFLASNHLTRTDLIVALGGGVVGDLAGFAAATYQRGIDYVQIPTTLLAAVDSSVGGKTAVDLSVGKNLVGAFHQPLLVWCDPETLATLPEKVYRDGCAEVIKYGLLGDADFLAYLKENHDRLDLTAVIARCVEMKRDIVSRDEFDRGERQFLNLGHTFGHAIESCSGYTLSHGHAVAMGMAIMCRAAVAKGLCDEATAALMEEILTLYGLPTAAPYGAGILALAALSDKKMKGGTITLVVPRTAGRCSLEQVASADLLDWLQAGGK